MANWLYRVAKIYICVAKPWKQKLMLTLTGNINLSGLLSGPVVAALACVNIFFRQKLV